MLIINLEIILYSYQFLQWSEKASCFLLRDLEIAFQRWNHDSKFSKLKTTLIIINNSCDFNSVTLVCKSLINFVMILIIYYFFYLLWLLFIRTDVLIYKLMVKNMSFFHLLLHKHLWLCMYKLRVHVALNVYCISQYGESFVFLSVLPNERHPKVVLNYIYEYAN